VKKTNTIYYSVVCSGFLRWVITALRRRSCSSAPSWICARTKRQSTDFEIRSFHRLPIHRFDILATTSIFTGFNTIQYNTIQYNKISSAQSIWSKTDCALHCPVRWE